MLRIFLFGILQWNEKGKVTKFQDLCVWLGIWSETVQSWFRIFSMKKIIGVYRTSNKIKCNWGWNWPKGLWQIAFIICQTVRKIFLFQLLVPFPSRTEIKIVKKCKINNSDHFPGHPTVKFVQCTLSTVEWF